MSYIESGYIESGYFEEGTTTRRMNNSGSGLLGVDSNPIDDALIKFTLVDVYGRPTNATASNGSVHIIKYHVTAALDSSGEFDLYLWPTDLSDTEVYYRCRVTVRGLDVYPQLIRPFPSGDMSAMTFSTWRAQNRWS